MIAINERFAAKRYSRGWELMDTQKSTDERSKSGIKTDVTFYATFPMLANRVIDLSIGDASDIQGVLDILKETKTEILNAIKLNAPV